MSTEQKQSVALSSVFASALLTVTKLVVGLLTGSLAILSEAAHSGLDLLAALLTWLAVRVSDKPADDDHTYGHGKVESVSALIETGLLFLTSAWIVYEGVQRLAFGGEPVRVTWYSVAVIVLSIVVDIARARALTKVAKETKSQALEADALHFSSDILSSAAVLVGLGLVSLGLPWADAAAALVVSGFVALAGYHLGRRTFDVLIDAAPLGMVEQVSRIARAYPGVARVERVRVRPAGATVFIELTVRVSRALALNQVHDICDGIGRRITDAIPGADPLVRAEPIALDSESIIETVQIIARNRSVPVHDIAVHTVGESRQVSLDLEIDEDMPIGTAHVIATELEEAIRAELGGSVGVDTHLDPRRTRIQSGKPVDAGLIARVTTKVLASAQSLNPPVEIHNVKVQGESDGLYISCHCVFPEAMPIRRVHDRTVRLEALIWEHVPGVERVVVHAEPLHHTDDTSDFIAAMKRGAGNL
ncbi:MAG: cation diffusion facilitator family transporter [Rhodospirillaceae bacterium]